MELISKADVVLALGTRLNPFSTLPGYGIDYWPQAARLIQVDINADRIGLTKRVEVAIQGDARRVAQQLLEQLSPDAGNTGREDRLAEIARSKTAWSDELATMDHEDDDPGTTWNQRSRDSAPERMSPRQAWRAIMRRHSPRRQSSPRISATTVPSATLIRVLKQAVNISRRGFWSLRLWLPVDSWRQDWLP